MPSPMLGGLRGDFLPLRVDSGPSLLPTDEDTVRGIVDWLTSTQRVLMLQALLDYPECRQVLQKGGTQTQPIRHEADEGCKARVDMGSVPTPSYEESAETPLYIGSEHQHAWPPFVSTPIHHSRPDLGVGACNPDSEPDGGIVVPSGSTQFTVTSTPSVYLRRETPFGIPHAHCLIINRAMQSANAMLDRKRPRPSYRAIISDSAPQAPKSFTPYDDHVILGCIYYYVGDYNTIELNWHVIYYYYSHIVNNNRTLSSLRSRFHKYLKTDLTFDITLKEHSYWIDLLHFCLANNKTKRPCLCPLTGAPVHEDLNEIHYFVVYIFVALRPEASSDDLARLLVLWLSLVQGPFSFC